MEPYVRWGCRSPKMKGQFSGIVRAIQKHWQSRCTSRCSVAAKGIIQSPITPCSRKDHSVCQASANTILKISGRKGGGGIAQRGRSLISTIALLNLCSSSKVCISFRTKLHALRTQRIGQEIPTDRAIWKLQRDSTWWCL